MVAETRQTRRTVLKAGVAATGVGAVAGCLGTSGPADGESAYSVTMEPVGTVEFDAVPETWLAFTGDYADMGVALGQGDGLVGIGLRSRYATHHYEELPGVAIDPGDLTQLWDGGTDTELFYELEADVHVVDPNFAINRLNWSRDDVDRIAEVVGPFVGNTIFSVNYDWHDYTRYTLYEAFEKIADVFQERARYEAFATLHEEVLTDVHTRLPDERPTVAVLVPKSAEPDAFYPYHIDEGTQSKHWNDLRVDGALAANGVGDAQATGGAIGYETLLEIDPDVIAIRQQGAVTESEFERGIVAYMRNHDAASELRAVRDDRVIYGGMTYQGPIIHLFQLERTAQGLYPDTFGGEALFDRERVAAIVTGDF
ncbi:ABC transporter substrate-binding protein [Natrinema sp. 74]|uniref:ABC transporter substrate-binding protein n=1 Tax=Natrinema sp. 74 TaxID=3384159 RepID=UPI0038D4CF18